MKQFLISFICLMSVCSCQTTKFDPQQASLIVGSMLPPATKLAITKKPETKKYFVLLADSIELFALNKDLSPTKLQNVIKEINSPELSTPEAQAAITSIISLYKSFYGDVVSRKLDEKNLKQLLEVISTSIRNGVES